MVLERSERDSARARSIDHDSIPYTCVMMTHIYEKKTKVDTVKNPTRANSNGKSGFRRISTISDLDLYDLYDTCIHIIPQTLHWYRRSALRFSAPNQYLSIAYSTYVRYILI